MLSFTYTVVFALGFSWQEALALVFICGVINILITVTKIRKLIIVGIPEAIQHAIGGGIGVSLLISGSRTLAFTVHIRKHLALIPSTASRLWKAHWPSNTGLNPWFQTAVLFRRWLTSPSRCRVSLDRFGHHGDLERRKGAWCYFDRDPINHDYRDSDGRDRFTSQCRQLVW